LKSKNFIEEGVSVEVTVILSSDNICRDLQIGRYCFYQ